MPQTLTEEDIAAVVRFIGTLPIVEDGQFGYDNPVLVCLDAVLSMNRRYERFAYPRVVRFQQEYAGIRSLGQLVDLIHDLGHIGFRPVWNYNHPARVVILENLANRFLAEKARRGDPDDLAAMRAWAREAIINDYATFGVPGIGIATFQYIRMLLGVSTVKPDVHIKRAISSVVGWSVGDLEAVSLVERASAELGLPTIAVDNSIWVTASGRLL